VAAQRLELRQDARIKPDMHSAILGAARSTPTSPGKIPAIAA
jgi:hypothetical protein